MDKVPRRLHFLARYASQKMGPTENVIIVEGHPDLSKDEIFIAFEDVEQVIKGLEIGNQVITTYMSCMKHRLDQHGRGSHYGFVPAHLCSRVTPKDDTEEALRERRTEIMKIFQNNPKGMVFFMPYNSGYHWNLSIISPWEDAVLYLNPLPKSSIHAEFRSLITMILNDFKLQNAGRGVKFNAGGKTEFKVSQHHPRQPDNVSCGYYVLRYIKDILDEGPFSSAKKKKTSYTQEDIDEVKFLWADYIIQFIKDI